tara:strand:- start:14522 stop:15028 length:507 start_codon:yes stop_codon:yes gene_type:complete
MESVKTIEQFYQERVETSLNKALPDIAFYLLFGLITGSLLEHVMPKTDDEKDAVALILEIFAQIALIIFAFMLISSKKGGRHGIIVFILAIVGTQPTLLLKINALREKFFGKPPPEKIEDLIVEENPAEEEPEEEVLEVPQIPVAAEPVGIESQQLAGATSICNLPQM